MAKRLIDYEANLETNLQDLLIVCIAAATDLNPVCVERFRKAMARRGRWGIACVEDKVVQRAIVMILERSTKSTFATARMVSDRSILPSGVRRAW